MTNHPIRTIPDLVKITPAARAVLDACRNAGGRPLIVGGTVRDAMIARHTGRLVISKDVDIEVQHVTLEALMNELPGDIGINGKAFQVLNVHLYGESFDISLPRRDSKSGSGHRDFLTSSSPDISIAEAFARRDLTINAMGWDYQTGELVDPFRGESDIASGILRHTSDAFADDPLRVLRAVQFAGRFGYDIAPETLTLCQSMHDEFRFISHERIWEEFHKLVSKSVRPSKALNALCATGWESHFPDLAAIRDVPQDPSWHPEGTVDVHAGLAADSAVSIATRDDLNDTDRTVLVLAAILHDFGKATHTQRDTDGKIRSLGHDGAGVQPALRFLNQIGTPHHIIRKVLPLIREHMCHAGIGAHPTPTAVRRLMRRLAGPSGQGPDIIQWARLVDADMTGRGAGNKEPIGSYWVALATSMGDGRTMPRDSILRGHHIIAAGLEPGPIFSTLIAESVQAQDDGIFMDEPGAVEWLTNRLSL